MIGTATLSREHADIVIVAVITIMRVTSAGIYEMQHIQQDVKEDLLNGSHVCRHTEGAAAVSGDHYGEQTYVKQGKQAGD